MDNKIIPIYKHFNYTDYLVLQIKGSENIDIYVDFDKKFLIMRYGNNPNNLDTYSLNSDDLETMLTYMTNNLSEASALYYIYNGLLELYEKENNNIKLSLKQGIQIFLNTINLGYDNYEKQMKIKEN